MYYGAFESCGAENYVLPDGVKYIGPAVFSGSGKLESLSLPSTLEKIADDFINDGRTPVITMRDGGSNAYFDVGQALIAKGAAADGGDRLIKFARVGEENTPCPPPFRRSCPLPLPMQT